ncbi:MAG: glycosyltransferase family 4 protein [Methanotrichaceae archaeon]|nr:glycosyltransferase family 4 protein [Methanotrichaceae archaeon]
MFRRQTKKIKELFKGENLRIAYFVQEYTPKIVGGLGTYAQYMCTALADLGHEITIFTLNDGTLKTEENIGGVEIYRPMTINIPRGVLDSLLPHDIHHWGIPGIVLYNIFSAAKFIDLIKKERKQFDIIVVHDWLSGIAGMIAENNTDLPLVFHLHSTEPGRALGNGSQTIASIEEKTGEAAKRIITVSFAMEEDLINQGFDPRKIRVCWNGVDTQKYDPKKVTDEERLAIRRKYQIEDYEKMLLFIGRLIPVKGVIELVEAMTMVKDPKVKLVILGQGDLEGTVANLISQLELTDKIKTCFEFVPEEERIRHLAACNIAVFPSKYEPFGIVALEAMAMEKPVIVEASGISGFRELVVSSGDYRNGTHVNGQNPADIFGWGLKPLLSLSPEELMEMGKRGRVRVEKYFTWTRIAKQTAEIYAQTIEIHEEY